MLFSCTPNPRVHMKAAHWWFYDTMLLQFGCLRLALPYYYTLNTGDTSEPSWQIHASVARAHYCLDRVEQDATISSLLRKPYSGHIAPDFFTFLLVTSGQNFLNQRHMPKENFAAQECTDAPKDGFNLFESWLKTKAFPIIFRRDSQSSAL